MLKGVEDHGPDVLAGSGGRTVRFRRMPFASKRVFLRRVHLGGISHPRLRRCEHPSAFKYLPGKK